jgi:hypothetical protein
MFISPRRRVNPYTSFVCIAPVYKFRDKNITPPKKAQDGDVVNLESIKIDKK